MWSLRHFFSFFNRKVKIEKKRLISCKPSLSAILSYLANFPEETEQLENGPNSIKVSLIIPSKYMYFICFRFIFTEYEKVYEL